MQLSPSLLLVVPLVLLAAPRADAQHLRVEFVSSTGGRPVAITSPPGETDRLFVVLKQGKINIVENGQLLSTPFLDWTANMDDSATARSPRAPRT